MLGVHPSVVTASGRPDRPAFQFRDNRENLASETGSIGSDTHVTARSETAEATHLTQAWTLAIRVAGVSAVLCSTVAYALHRFAGVGAPPLVGLATLAGLGIGLRLPTAAPLFLQPLDPDDGELDLLIDDRG